MKTLIHTRAKMAVAILFLGWATAQLAPAADLRVPTTNYPTIQAAVNAANSNDTIHIAAGVYAGQVLISNKFLTLSGSPGTVLRATSGMGSPYTAMGFTLVPLLGIFRSEVVVSNLTFEGEHLADTYSDPQSMKGIFYFGSSGRVENCRIMGFRGGSLDAGGAFGLQVSNPAYLGTSAVNIQIVGCTFADNWISVVLIGDSKSFTHATFDPTLLRTSFVVNDNTITGNGPEATGVQYGIQILSGATGEVSRNTISDHAYVGTTDPNPYAFGILALDDMNFGEAPLAPLKPVRFEGNVLRNNQWHMGLLRGDGSTIVDNTFEGTAPGLRPTGLALSGENVLIGRNRFSDLSQGIVLFGNDPDFGTYLGIAHNAQLNTNRFCNVTTNIDQQSPATATQQGTLLCPFPPPVLDIQVLLSWPTIEGGFQVETAPSPDGQWTPSDATPSMQDGRHRLPVPANSEHRFFRLRKP